MAQAMTTHFHARTAVEVAQALEVDIARGLSADEAAARLLRGGANQLEAHEPPSVWRSLFGAATEPFVLLLAAAGIGAVVLGEVRDGLLVLGGLIPIVGADVATAYRSERALAELRAAVAPGAHVRARRVERGPGGRDRARATCSCWRPATSCLPTRACCPAEASSSTAAS